MTRIKTSAVQVHGWAFCHGPSFKGKYEILYDINEATLIDFSTLSGTALACAILVLAFVESAPIVGIIIPGVVLLWGAAAAAAAAGVPLGVVLAAAAVGGICGDLLGFAVGKRYGQDAVIKYLAWLSKKGIQPRFTSHTVISRYALPVLIFSRFLGPTRPVTPLIAGSFGIPVRTIVIALVISALPWAALYTGPAYIGGSIWSAIRVGEQQWMILTLGAMATLWFVHRIPRARIFIPWALIALGVAIITAGVVIGDMAVTAPWLVTPSPADGAFVTLPGFEYAIDWLPLALFVLVCGGASVIYHQKRLTRWKFAVARSYSLTGLCLFVIDLIVTLFTSTPLVIPPSISAIGSPMIGVILAGPFVMAAASVIADIYGTDSHMRSPTLTWVAWPVSLWVAGGYLALGVMTPFEALMAIGLSLTLIGIISVEREYLVKRDLVATIFVPR